MTEKHGRKSWRKSWRLFNQTIYIYLISCRIELSFQVKLSSQASQLNLSSQIQLLNSTWYFFKKISIQLNAISLLMIKRRYDCHFFQELLREK